MKYDLSVIIPARCEMFVTHTIKDLLKNIRGKTEIIVGLDGEWSEPGIEDHPQVTILKTGEAVGQRAITNTCARLSKAKYIAKTDAHCAFDEGFDVKLMKDMQDDWTVTPILRNLHVFDWVCPQGHRRYQGNSGPCETCGQETHREIVWIAKTNPQNKSFCFDSQPHFQYFREYKKKGDITESMSLQGSFFMCTRKKYWELDLCDESFGNWGSQGIEVAVKTWLSGGQIMVNHNTWYAHLFRTAGGDFGFPWPASGRSIQAARKHARELFFNNKWPKQTKPLSWLVEKFWPVKGWTDEDLKALKETDGNFKAETGTDREGSRKDAGGDLTRGIVFYTDNRLEDGLAERVRQHILLADLPISSVSLQPIDFGKNIVFPGERSYETMFKQILAGLEAMETDIIFLCEHDVIYSQEHFKFTPPRKDIFYYNKNCWQVRQADGHAVYWDAKRVSQICGYRDLFLQHYRERIRKVAETGFSRRMGFEPGTHGRPERVDDLKSEFFETKIPNLDVRHKFNLTSSRWSPDKFRNKPKNWKESHVNKLPGWEDLKL